MSLWTALTYLLPVVGSIVGFFFIEGRKEIAKLKQDVSAIHVELMKRAEIVNYVGQEVDKLRAELKSDNDQVMALIMRMDEKIEKIYEIMVSK